MFVDEITIHAKAGNGGDGVVRWLREWGRPWGGPSGGNGGKGGDIVLTTVRNNNILRDYVGTNGFRAKDGAAGANKSNDGKNGEDLVIAVPVGSRVTNLETGRTQELREEGMSVVVLKGGHGGLGNEYFKSSTNRSPEEHTLGKSGEEADLLIEVELAVDAGFIGLPNAGKSTLLSLLTHSETKIGAYPFTTLEPHLGDLYGLTLADIPGLIEGAALGKGLGHKFLRHVRRTKLLIHCVSLENEDPVATYESIRAELSAFDPALLEKPEIVVLTKSDLVTPEVAGKWEQALLTPERKVFVVSSIDEEALKSFRDELVRILRAL